jgi:hypothetical protein
MAVWMPQCGLVHDTTELATDVEVVAAADVRDFVADHGGRVFVWISVHPGFPASLCLLETALKPPMRDVGFRRIGGPGFDVYLESTQRTWPKVLEFALKRRRRVEAYWNGLAWIA